MQMDIVFIYCQVAVVIKQTDIDYTSIYIVIRRTLGQITTQKI